jgi:hypothetical protein
MTPTSGYIYLDNILIIHKYSGLLENVCVCVCVYEREGGGERESTCVYMCVYISEVLNLAEISVIRIIVMFFNWKIAL